MKLFLTSLLTFLLIFFTSVNSFCQDSIDINEKAETILSYGIENDFVTRYIWNGLSYNHGIIHQPTLWLTYNDFTIYSWASFTQHEFDNNVINNEIDLAVQYSKQLNIIGLETSLTYIYALQDNAAATTEAYLKLSCGLFETELYSDVTVDVMENLGSFSGSVGFNKQLFENDELSLSTGLCIGWANNKFNKNYIGLSENVNLFNYSMLYVESTYNIFDNIYIKPHIEYCYLFSPVFKSISGNSLTNFGITAGVEF